MTVKEVAERLNVHVFTIKRWIHLGKLKANKIKKPGFSYSRWEVDEKDLSVYLKQYEERS